MDNVNNFSSLKQRVCGSEEPSTTSARLTDIIGSKALGNRATSRADSSLLRRSVKCLVIGGLAASCGYFLERGVSKAADVARVSGSFPMSDVGVMRVRVTTKASDIEAATPMNPCMQGLIAGGVGSMLVQNPLPLVIGVSGCLPMASAQQRVGNEFQVNTYTTNDQWYSSVASFGNGNFVVTWQSQVQDGSLSGVYGQLFDVNANRIGNEFQVNTYTFEDQSNPSVASFDNGNFVVTWHSLNQDGSSWGVHGQLFDGNATRIGNEFPVNTYTTSHQAYPEVANFNNGNFVVTWQSDGQDGSSEGIYGQMFDGNSTRIGNEFQANTYTTESQSMPVIASFSNGNFVVSWHSDSQDGSDLGVYGQVFDGNGTKLGNEFQANTYVTAGQRYPSVASFNNGNFVVAWHSSGQDGSSWGMYGQVFDGNGTKLGSEFQANTNTNDWQIQSSIASFSNENFIVTWTSYLQDGSNWGVYGQLFYDNTTKLGNEFQVNTYTAGGQWHSHVASLSNGNFVVTWQSDGQDGDGSGIYGQLFEGPQITSSTTSTTSETITSSSTISSSSSVFNSTTNPLTSSTDVFTFNSSSNSSSRNYPSTTEMLSSSSSNQIATSNQQSSTSPTTFTSIPTTFTTITEETSVSGNSSGLWIGLGAGILLCLGLAGGGVAFILKRRNESENIVELGSPDRGSFVLVPKVKKSYKEIGEAYYQLSRIRKDEAEKIYKETGYLVLFPDGTKKVTPILGEGNFGKIKIAQRIEDEMYVASKKVKGEDNIDKSKKEAYIQQDAEGDNVLPIYNTIELEEALYHFMPLAGGGNGIEIQSQLSLLKDRGSALEAITFIARDLLTGLKTIHSKSIYHLDIKPENMVFIKDGTGYITDFGCAKKDDEISWDSLGDNRYFSPERYQACRERIDFDGGKADAWAAGKTLLQMAKDLSPLKALEMPEKAHDRFQDCTQDYFKRELSRIEELDAKEGSMWWVIKGLLDPNTDTRLTAKEALKAPCFKELKNRKKRSLFEDLKAEKLEQKSGDTSLDMENYHSVAQAGLLIADEEGAFYSTEEHRKYYMTPV